MKLMSMVGGGMAGAGGTGAAPHAAPGGMPGGLNPDMLMKMMSMLGGGAGTNRNPGGGSGGLPLPGPLANLSPEMIMGIMSLLSNIGGGRPAPNHQGNQSPPQREVDEVDAVLPDDNPSDYGDNPAMNPQMMMMLMNLLSSMNQGQTQRPVTTASPVRLSATEIINE